MNNEIGNKVFLLEVGGEAWNEFLKVAVSEIRETVKNQFLRDLWRTMPGVKIKWVEGKEYTNSNGALGLLQVGKTKFQELRDDPKQYLGIIKENKKAFWYEVESLERHLLSYKG